MLDPVFLRPIQERLAAFFCAGSGLKIAHLARFFVCKNIIQFVILAGYGLGIVRGALACALLL
jgi:hypothetical protein